MISAAALASSQQGLGPSDGHSKTHGACKSSNFSSHRPTLSRHGDPNRMKCGRRDFQSSRRPVSADWTMTPLGVTSASPDNLEIDATGVLVTALLLNVACSRGRRPIRNAQTDLWSAYAAEGISSTSLSDRDQEIRELRQQVQDLTGVLETTVVPSTLEILARRMVARSEMDSSSCSGQLVGRCEIVGLVARSGPLGRSCASASCFAHISSVHPCSTVEKLLCTLDCSESDPIFCNHRFLKVFLHLFQEDESKLVKASVMRQGLCSSVFP